MQQAIQYAEMLGIPFAYATNGEEIIERNLLAGTEASIGEYPGPEELWARWKAHASASEEVERVGTTPYHSSQLTPRYYDG